MTRPYKGRCKTNRSAGKVRWAVIDRPGDVGLDLPAGKSARDLGPMDYHPMEMERPVAPAQGAARRAGERKAARRTAPR